ncbi:MAG: methylated-DNA--[protein]-cysteine S-methyltransferase [SAR324 cluster bacterium]|nr:methylated-DNA--[protein]-cysteine S-methyltransferase [SAR324 cluster bacterium]
MYYCYTESPIGNLLIAGSRSTLKKIIFPKGKMARDPSPEWIEDAKYFKNVLDQLRAYFNGKLKVFDLQLSAEGTTFQKNVWDALKKIPYGETFSYGEIAALIGSPKASRAVGAANGQNPIPIVIPCHRVIGKSGDLTGFGGGLDTKIKLLSLEQEVISPQTSFSFQTSAL